MADGVNPDFLRALQLERAIQDAVRRSMAPQLPPLRAAPIGRFIRVKPRG